MTKQSGAGKTKRCLLYAIFTKRINEVKNTPVIFPILMVLMFGPISVQAKEIRLLAFGNSLVSGYGLNKSDSFTEQLEARLRATGQRVKVINAGVSGDTTAGGLARLDWTLAIRPDAVMLELGANDGLRGINPKVIYKNLDIILARLTKMKIPVLFIGMLAPPNMGEEYSKEFREVFVTLSKQYSVVFYPFFLKGVAGKVELNQPDGIHPNRDGVAIIIDQILLSVQIVLEIVRSKKE